MHRLDSDASAVNQFLKPKACACLTGDMKSSRELDRSAVTWKVMIATHKDDLKCMIADLGEIEVGTQDVIPVQPNTYEDDCPAKYGSI